MKLQQHIFERGESIYMVSQIAPFRPADSEVDELAWAEDVRRIAPNENILWLRGQYVQADHANENGQLWASDEISINSLTPMFMPVTVMHDPRTAVGLIADVSLLVPPESTPARIDDTLAIWAHRFPDVVEEIAANYEAGTLMQSQECRPQFYDCDECERRFPKLPGGAERVNWCSHLAENAKAVRRLGNVTFTGTGLIFGTRGARGALDTAHLEVLQDEVAEFHSEAKREPSTRKPRRRKGIMELEDRDYQDLVAARTERDNLKTRISELEETAAKVPDLEKKVEQTEAQAATEKKRADDEQKKREDLEETARTVELKNERLGGLGKGFVKALGDFTKTRLEEQAGTLDDEAWDNRLKEIEETADVKRDFAGDGKDDPDDPDNKNKGGGSTFTDEEVSRAGVTGGSGAGGGGGDPKPAHRRAIVGGLVKAVSGSNK